MAQLKPDREARHNKYDKKAVRNYLQTFRRVRKTAKSDYWLRQVCLSIRKVQFGSQWTDFYEI
jgi:hypothetical protein